jgi:hypothetical protein
MSKAKISFAQKKLLFGISFFAAVFLAVFFVVAVPATIADGDIIGAFAAGFVNPYAAAYSTDVFMCWAILACWVIYERTVYKVQHGWLALLLGAVPGVAFGFALYLFMRMTQGRD